MSVRHHFDELSPAAQLRVDELCDQFEAAWRAGTPHELDTFIAAAAPEDRMALAAALAPLDAEFRASSSQDATTGFTPTESDDSTTQDVSGPPGFAIQGELGRGGMGVVYRAVQEKLNRPVALKMMLGGRATQNQLIRFLAEAEAVAAIRHPNVVQVFEYGEHHGSPYIALEYLSGGTLADREKLDPQTAATILAKVARGVGAAHDRGIVHRDLKPGNILFAEHDEPKVADFGLAKRDNQTDLTATREFMGTPAYMAPEQARGEAKFVGPAADVWALGVMLYQCLTGKRPFAGHDMVSVLRQIIDDVPVAPRKLTPGVPRDLETICLKCLDKDAQKRYATAGDMADDLDRFLKGEPIHARQASLTRRAYLWARRHPERVASIAFLAVLVLVAGIAWRTIERRRERDRQQELVRELLDAEPIAAAQYGARLNLELTRDQLHSEIAGNDSRRAFNAALALGGADTEAGRFLLARALVGEPDDVRLIRSAFRPESAPIDECWNIFRDSTREPSERLRAAVILALFDAQNPGWDGQADFLLDVLVTEPANRLAVWASVLKPAGASMLLAHERRLDLEPDGQKFDTLISLLALHDAASLIRIGATALPMELPISTLMDLPSQWGRPENAVERRCRIRARALALALVEQSTPVGWEALADSPDPRLRSHLMHEFVRCGFPATRLMEEFERNTDPAIRQALLLALGEYEAASISAVRQQFLLRLRDIYRTDPDAGVHAACAWLAYRWGQAASSKETGTPGADASGLAGRQWYFDPDGRSYTIVRGPVEFVTGSPLHEFYRDAHGTEREVRRLVPRDFAVAQREVIARDFLDMMRELNSRPPWTPFAALAGPASATAASIRGPLIRPREFTELSRYFPQPDCAMGEIHPRDAMIYCRWLSERHGVPENQMCYPSVWEIAGGGKPYPDYLQRTGYRLPTEAEWEHAARAGSPFPFHFGATDLLIDKYAWSSRNAFDSSRPVGQLKPNRHGLFDVQGNVFEWVHGGRLEPSDARTLPVNVDHPGTDVFYQNFSLRGGSFARNAQDFRLAYRWGFGSNGFQFDIHTGDMGMRVARTIGVPPVVAIERFDRTRESFTLDVAGTGKYQIQRIDGDVTCTPASGTLPAKIQVTGTFRGENWFAFSIRSEGSNEELRVWRDPDEKVVRMASIRTVHGGLRMALIPAGKFRQGTDREQLKHMGPERLHQFEEAPRNVEISKPFSLGVEELTVAQFREFIRETGYKTDYETNPNRPWYAFANGKATNGVKLRWEEPGYPFTEAMPVTCLTIDDADRFCDWVSKKAKETFRVPTEAEWEYACRAGTTTLYHWGDSAALLSKYAVQFPVHGVPQRAGLRPNPFGLHDMSGNVSEMTADGWFESPYAPGNAKDPFVPRAKGGPSWVVRGGSLDARAFAFRSAFRGYCTDGGYNMIGVRLAGPSWTSTISATVTDHRAGREFDLVGSANAFTVESSSDTRIEPRQGGLPGTLYVSRPIGQAAEYDFTVKAGDRPVRVAGAFLEPKWKLRYMPWRRTNVLPSDDDVRESKSKEPFWEGTVDSLSLRWAPELMPRGIPHQFFVFDATTRIDCSSGHYEICLECASGARVFVDGKQVLSTWNLGRLEAARVGFDLEAGPHEILVEGYQLEAEQTFKLYVRRKGAK